MSLTRTQKSRGNSAEWVFQIGNLQKLNTCQASGTSWNEVDREVTFFEDRNLGVDIFFYQARGDRQSDKSPANDCNLFP